MRWMRMAAIAAALWAGSAAKAQIGQPGTGTPGGFGRNNQPVSPYLNLLRGANTAVNYYTGVRGNNQPFGYAGMFNQSAQGPRQTFFPVVDTLSELADDPNAARVVSPTGHPVGFNNTMGYFGGSPQQGNRPQQQSPVGRGR